MLIGLSFNKSLCEGNWPWLVSPTEPTTCGKRSGITLFVEISHRYPWTWSAVNPTQTTWLPHNGDGVGWYRTGNHSAPRNVISLLYSESCLPIHFYLFRTLVSNVVVLYILIYLPFFEHISLFAASVPMLTCSLRMKYKLLFLVQK